MMGLACDLLTLIGGTALAACLYQFALQSIIRYKLTSASIAVRICGLIPVCRIKLEDVIEVRKIRLADWFKLGFREWINCVNLTNRLFGHHVLITRNGGFFTARNVIITPDDPDGFIDQVNQMKAGIAGG